jgi:CheY-like chemotaxis protein
MRDPASIVVVEDNPTDVFLINEALAAHGLRADLTVFEDGDRAIGLIARIEAEESVPCPRLMLLDLNLPGADGFAVLERLRKSQRCAAIRVIVMSSSAVPSDRNRSVSLGADAYFQKQVGYSASLEIGAIIRELLE